MNTNRIFYTEALRQQFEYIHTTWAQSFGCSKSFASTSSVTYGLRISEFPIRTSYRNREQAIFIISNALM